jgi:transcriptional regulator with XRE-family HTH domain
MQLANRIRQIRQAYGYSQAEIAYKCDITPQAYSQIERRAGKSTFETLQKIAGSIGVSVSFLVDITSNEYIEKNKL